MFRVCAVGSVRALHNSMNRVHVWAWCGGLGAPLTFPNVDKDRSGQERLGTTDQKQAGKEKNVFPKTPDEHVS